MEFHVSDAVAYIAETLIIWDYLISIDDEVGTDRPLSYAANEPLLGRIVLGMFRSLVT
ncbi:uncharacterized protein ARMOST_17367 [Armillaria ostoyae]|uniref:Uncharacterized protein n=1 Tax=Armillaria ostoyae TaxID=47428 RepID=A0A284RYV2_ARMOS|nr:uncharacterized protein ARMOST_17367 [Armillaria ostoyae]